MPATPIVPIVGLTMGNEVAASAFHRISRDAQIGLAALQKGTEFPGIPGIPGTIDPVPGPFPTRSLVPAPLSPDQFPDISEQPPTSSSSESGLSDDDRRTFQRALELLKTAQTDISSADQKQALSGRRSAFGVIGYLTGFFDSRGLLKSAKTNPGLVGLFGEPVEPSFEDMLAELINKLTELLEQSMEVRTARKVVADVLDAIGDIVIGAGVYIFKKF